MRYLQVKTTNLYDESGKVSRMVGSIEDVTDMENDMLKLQKEARTDLLTGAMNRAAGTSAINRMLVQELHPGCVNTFAIVGRQGSLRGCPDHEEALQGSGHRLSSGR